MSRSTVSDDAEVGDAGPVRACLALTGAVQGVGFRPFVFRLATAMGLAGWVNNCPRGVRIEIEGPHPRVRQFIHRLGTEPPPHTRIQEVQTSFAAPRGDTGFRIRPSDTGQDPATVVLPDLATCPECRAEIFDPQNRRYFYPFTNCTQCGPRFSILRSLPYDRANTTMQPFTMCNPCQAEYEDPADRRFHAQPNACPACGPQLALWDRAGDQRESGGRALAAAAAAIRHGLIVAVKGLGGFHLMVAATDAEAVSRLRARKHRAAKPFALMCPSLTVIRDQCEVGPLEERLLVSAEAPIVLLRRRRAPHPAGRRWDLAPQVAPGNSRFGVMLPYTPLHHLLLNLVGAPVVATSGNRAEEPICIDEHEAVARLSGIADLFLVHNRAIVRPVDDSVVHVVASREQVLRRARGYAPLPIAMTAQSCIERVGPHRHSASRDPRPDSTEPVAESLRAGPPREVWPSTLAVGAHSKNAVALAAEGQVFLSQHIGDLDNAAARAAFRRAIGDLEQVCGAHPTAVAADAHPDYPSSRFARESGLAQVTVQHHYAHVLSCMAEHGLEGTLLGVAWDGTGFGADTTIWGGEFLRITPRSWERVGHLRTFPLPGGESAVYEPRRSALGLLYELFGEPAFAMKELASLRAFTAKEVVTLRQMLVQQVNGPLTSSAGRLFDGVASLLDLRQRVQFEGQAAMDLEFAADAIETDEAYRLRCRPTAAAPGGREGGRSMIVDWAPMIEALLHDTRAGLPAWEIAVKFHNALAEIIVTMAQHVGESRVVLSGGCFQNRLLTERTVELLRSAGFQPYWHQRVPPNDGGIALGQIAAVARQRCAAPGSRPKPS